MENSVTAIIEMDKKARALADKAAENAEKILADAKAKREALASENADKLSAQADKRLSELRAVSDKEIKSAEKTAEEKCRSLDEKMYAGKAAWKKEITERILTLDQ